MPTSIGPQSSKQDITGNLCLQHIYPEEEIIRVKPNKHAGIKLCSVG